MTELDTTTDRATDRTDPAPNAYAIRNVRALIDSTIVDDAVVGVADGRIESIGHGTGPADAIDGRRLLLLPGLVDTHSDGLEKEVNPRRTSFFPIDYAIRAFEGRLRSSGITTVFHGVGYQEKERAGRTIAKAQQLSREIIDRRSDPSAAVDHRILFRLEARDPRAVAPLLADLDRGAFGYEPGGEAPMVSFEDHTPGQGQYRDPAAFQAAVDPTELPDGQTVEDYVDEIMREAAANDATRDRNIQRLTPRALNGSIRLLAHDIATEGDIATAAEVGATIAEFPVSVEAGRAARSAGMGIVMGAPNALRGSSHSGNASARELVAFGLCDALASDYLPPAMLNAAFVVAKDGCCSLPKALRLITSGPAELTGLTDRGRIQVGARADLILVDDRASWPTVVGVRRADDATTQHVFG